MNKKILLLTATISITLGFGLIGIHNIITNESANIGLNPQTANNSTITNEGNINFNTGLTGQNLSLVDVDTIKDSQLKLQQLENDTLSSTMNETSDNTNKSNEKMSEASGDSIENVSSDANSSKKSSENNSEKAVDDNENKADNENDIEKTENTINLKYKKSKKSILLKLPASTSTERTEGINTNTYTTTYNNIDFLIIPLENKTKAKIIKNTCVSCGTTLTKTENFITCNTCASGLLVENIDNGVSQLIDYIGEYKIKDNKISVPEKVLKQHTKLLQEASKEKKKLDKTEKIKVKDKGIKYLGSVELYYNINDRIDNNITTLESLDDETIKILEQHGITKSTIGNKKIAFVVTPLGNSALKRHISKLQIKDDKLLVNTKVTASKTTGTDEIRYITDLFIISTKLNKIDMTIK